MEIKKIATFCTGKYHKQKMLQCQDYAGGYSFGDVHAIAVCDGAGSKQYSHSGAEMVAECVLEFICTDYHKLLDQDYQHIAQQITDRCSEWLDKSEFPKDQLATTLIFVASDGQHYISGHIGDGFIFHLSCGQTKVFSYPENGSTPSETFFITDKSASAHLRIQSGCISDGCAFVLASDGAADVLYSKDESMIAPAVGKMAEWLEHYDEQTITSAIYENLETSLSQKTNDDLSIAILYVKGEDIC